MDQANINREFVKRHFEAVNRRDIQTVVGNTDRRATVTPIAEFQEGMTVW